MSHLLGWQFSGFGYGQYTSLFPELDSGLGFRRQFSGFGYEMDFIPERLPSPISQ